MAASWVRWAAVVGFCVVAHPAEAATKPLRAGAATSNITPWLGLSINGSMNDHAVAHVHDELHARALVLDDGESKLAFIVCDMCMIPREIVTAAKTRIQERTGIAPDHVLISATHAHSCLDRGCGLPERPRSRLPQIPRPPDCRRRVVRRAKLDTGQDRLGIRPERRAGA